MGSIFKPKVEIPQPPQIEMPDETNVPSAEDAAREAAEAEEMRRRLSKKKRSKIYYSNITRFRR